MLLRTTPNVPGHQLLYVTQHIVRPAVVTARTFAEHKSHDIGQLFECRTGLERALEMLEQTRLGPVFDRRIAFLGEHAVDVNQRQIDPHADKHNTGHPACPLLKLPQPIKRPTDGVSTDGYQKSENDNGKRCTRAVE